MGGEPILHRRGGEQRRRAQQIVAAAMTVAARLDRPRLGHARLLAETGQRIVFAEDSDHRTALARFAHHRGRNARDILGDAEPLMAQFGQMFGGERASV